MVGSGTIAGMSAPADSAASTVDSGRRRLDSIDVLRALAILTMILVHFVENLSNDEHGYRFLWSLADTLGSFSAPIFTFLVGASFAISLDRHRRRGQTESEIAVRTMRRALLIFLAGLLFQVFIWLPGAVFDWDILTFIGASIVVLWAIRNRSTGTVLAAVVGIVAFVNVPLVHYSINMWAADQQLHPPKVELAPVMQQTKFLCYFAFACLFALLMRLRLSQEHLAARLQALLRMTAHR